MTTDLIVNPASGPVRRGVPREGRLSLVRRLLQAHGVTTVRATETTRSGDAAGAVRAALAAGTDRVLVWGGDGTLNETAGGLLDTGVPLGVIPGGSGNGFARGLGLPLDVEAAVDVALHGRPHDIDTGVVDGRTFLNLAGVGFDAAVAEVVNTHNVRRGLRPYLAAILREWRTFEAARFRLVLDQDRTIEFEGHLVVVCNGQQYGHGARIAPLAAFDDGAFDVVAVPRITAARLVGQGWRLFAGSITRVPGVYTARARRVELSQARALPIHLDGEVGAAAVTRVFEVRPRSLRVMTP